MRSHPLRIVVFLTLVIVLIVAVVVIVVTLLKNRDVAVVAQQTLCSEPDNLPIETFSSSHPGCGSSLKPVSGCLPNSTAKWRIFERTSKGWNSAVTLLPLQIDNISSIVVSPFYTNISSNSCSLQISFNFQSNSSFQVFIVSSNLTHSIIVTSDNCHYGFIDDRSILSRISEFRVLIVSDSLIIGTEASGSVTSHSCYKYENIDHSPIVTSNPQFSTVRLGSRNLCSSEILQRNVNCDWWNVVGLGNANFTRQETHPCIARGVSYRENDGFSWFLSLNATYNETRALLISPIIEGGTSHLLLSLWYLAQCSGSVIRVFIVPSSRDIAGVMDEVSPVYQISEMGNKNSWNFATTNIEVPAIYKTYQVVIEGQASSNGSCNNYKCFSGTRQSQSVGTPLLAIDDIAVESAYDICTTNGSNVSVIDCNFQTPDNASSSLCSWKSTFPSSIPANLQAAVPFLAHWTAENELNSPDNGHGATSEHFTGRGYILTFDDGFGSANTDIHFRSPLLTANSNCTCEMSFMFLLRGSHTPRLQVNIVLGEDESLNTRPLIPQWSLYGNQSNDWVVADVLLNLQTIKPFQVELRVLEIIEGSGTVHVDDLYFYGCDFNLYKNKVK